MPAPRPAEIVERARVLVTTTTRPLDDIAAEVGVTVRTLRNWIKKHGWRRPPGAPGRVLKITPQNEGAVQRIFENRGSVSDLALLVGCDTSYIYHYARQRQWARSEGATEAPPLSDELAAIEAALRDPAAGRCEVVRLVTRAAALTAADVLVNPDARAERRTAMIGKLVAYVNKMREDAAPAHKDFNVDSGDHFPDANDLIEEIARRIEADANEWLDPRILAAIAAAVP